MKHYDKLFEMNNKKLIQSNLINALVGIVVFISICFLFQKINLFKLPNQSFGSIIIESFIVATAVFIFRTYIRRSGLKKEITMKSKKLILANFIGILITIIAFVLISLLFKKLNFFDFNSRSFYSIIIEGLVLGVGIFIFMNIYLGKKRNDE